MCSPTRAALLTGVNPHRAGVGHVAHADPGFPGYAGRARRRTSPLRPRSSATPATPRSRSASGTSAKDADMLRRRPAATRGRCSAGFDRYYGFLDAFTNLHHPHRLVEDNHAVERRRVPGGLLPHRRPHRPGDRLRDGTQGSRTRASRSSSTSPTARCTRRCDAKAADISRYRGRLRRRLGRDPPPAATSARSSSGCCRRARRCRRRNSEPGDDVAAWDELSATSRRVFARYMEVYAAMVDSIDQNVGRLRAALEELGEWDNTIVPVPRDNGAAAKGEAGGTTTYFSHLRLGADVGDVEVDATRLDADRVASDDEPLPARLGDGVEHAVPALQDQHPRRRPLGAVHPGTGPRGSRGAAPARPATQYGHVRRRAADAARHRRRASHRPSATVEH